jgi:ankyrin repeat protein
MTASGSNGAGRELLRLLLQSGAKPNPADRLGQTALRFASGAYGDAETQRLLLERGADWRATDWEGHTALWRASSARRPELIAALVKAGATQ